MSVRERDCDDSKTPAQPRCDSRQTIATHVATGNEGDGRAPRLPDNALRKVTALLLGAAPTRFPREARPFRSPAWGLRCRSWSRVLCSCSLCWHPTPVALSTSIDSVGTARTSPTLLVTPVARDAMHTSMSWTEEPVAQRVAEGREKAAVSMPGSFAGPTATPQALRVSSFQALGSWARSSVSTTCAQRGTNHLRLCAAR